MAAYAMVCNGVYRFVAELSEPNPSQQVLVGNIKDFYIAQINLLIQDLGFMKWISQKKMSIMFDDGAISAGPFNDDRLMLNSMTQKSSGERVHSATPRLMAALLEMQFKMCKKQRTVGHCVINCGVSVVHQGL